MDPTVRIPSAPPSHIRVPPELEGLRRLAYNLYWSWHPQARAVFGRINGGVWSRTHSPIPVLSSMVDWPSLLDNSDFMVEAQRAIADFDRYMENGADHWFHRRHAQVIEAALAGSTPPGLTIAWNNRRQITLDTGVPRESVGQ